MVGNGETAAGQCRDFRIAEAVPYAPNARKKTRLSAYAIACMALLVSSPTA